MRVCQFRHFGTEMTFGMENQTRQRVLVLQTVADVSNKRTAKELLASHSFYRHLTEDQNPMNETSSSPESLPLAEKIPASVAPEIRRLAHDLSNALEIVIQSTYLLSTSPLDESSQQWIGLLNEGVKRAAALNIDLREYIRRHS